MIFPLHEKILRGMHDILVIFPLHENILRGMHDILVMPRKPCHS